jgi:pimeloyl-ACP methyl ester carboxylesterase
VGRYGRGATDILYIKIRDGKLTMRPAFWHSIQVVDVKNDSFVVAERRDRGGSFIRNSRGEVIAVRIVGLADSPLRYVKLKQSGKLPLELLFDGKGKEAYRELRKECSYSDLLSAGTMFFEHFPTRVRVAVEYLQGLAAQFGDSSDSHVLLGRAYVAASMRPQALESFRRAQALNAGSRTAVNCLLRLHALSVPRDIEAAQWKVPYSLNELFKPPTSSEIKKVQEMWAGRDLSPVEPKEVTEAKLRFGNVNVVVRIVSHRVHGSLHYGAIIVPVQAKKGSCAVVVEAKGVSWNYFPLDINMGLNSPAILGSDLSRFVIIAPSFRGEKMILNGQEFLSEGDRRDNWDGATDDVLALLNVALRSTPEADSTQIYSFGRSRGGSVAMLAAERDKRIKGVVEWAGPSDWFELMAEQGWTQQELVEEGLRVHAKPYETAGQFIERFLLKAINGTWNLEETRLKMIASSPLYFASSLPNLQIHHGVEDYNVPIANAHALADSLKKKGRAGNDFEPYFYEGFGHDTDVQVATERSHKFLTEKMKSVR